MTGLVVLFTNNTLAERAGSELYVRDLAVALMRRGHRPMAYSPRLGAVADELRVAGVIVVDDPADVPLTPHVIHGQHNLTAMTAMLAHPGVPAIYLCHGTTSWVELVPGYPAIRQYVAVGEGTRDRVVELTGVPPEDVLIVPNFVEMSRFPRRGRLPVRPRSVLVLSNTAMLGNYAGVVKEAGRVRGLDVRIAGARSGDPLTEVGEAMRQADLVVAKGRTALEAMASGCAVIVADTWGLSGMVTAADLDHLRRRNLGIGSQTRPVTAQTFLAELDRYDRDDAAVVTDRIRAEADLEHVVDRWEEIYGDVVRQGTPTDVDGAAVSAYLRGLSGVIDKHEALRNHAREQSERLAQAANPRLIARQQAALVARREELTYLSSTRGSARALARALAAAGRRRFRRR